MDVSTLEWSITIAVTIAVLAFDVVVIARNPHEPSMRECTIAFIAYMSAAAAFGFWVMFFHGTEYGVDYFTGFIVEKSLSVDNLFVFIVLMAALKVPRKYQQEALMVGIILALVFRGIFIALGYQLVSNFSWVFYLFGAFLVYTAVKLVSSYRKHEEEHPEDNKVVQWAQTHLNVGEEYRGLKLWWKDNGVRVYSPMLIVILALGVTDILFALDSIPAIFGITDEPYLVFTANVFALMGLRQVYLSLGLAFILGWIGVKLFIHAAYKGGLIDWEVPTLLSLVVILVALTITAVASLAKSRSDAEVEVAATDGSAAVPPAPQPAERGED